MMHQYRALDPIVTSGHCLLWPVLQASQCPGIEAHAVDPDALGLNAQLPRENVDSAEGQ